ncbi:MULTISPECIES: hypothetical protein [unclassified Brenneria]|uniref:hypothetical protein n=1 Tax=unclassified Brenneria TaxID=2634434 RepID=UPI0029C21FDC|nr:MULTISPECIES: hypothetical protein [unclassified Brenneria]MDX5626885.1 hypothetical protein [Brenneria sp. L3-3Z]MDX5693765.1 hypothetical protein [Brenneria sp. L4-2C]
MKTFTTHHELKEELLKDPVLRAAYEAESQNPDLDYQIIRHRDDGTEEVVFDSAHRHDQ